MPPAPQFTLFGPSHLMVLFLTGFVPAVLIVLARSRGGERRVRPIAWTLAAVLVLNQVVIFVFAVRWGVVREHLPFQLCDWATFTCAAALVWRHRLAYELSYFWGLAGTVQAVLTPDLAEDFPHPGFFVFHIAHSGIIVAVFFLTLGMGMRPSLRSIGRAFLWLQVYAAATVLLNLLLDANYGYLLRKPARPSLLDYLGPWPWYIVSLEVLALLLFFLYYAPFAVADRLRRARARGAAHSPDVPHRGR
jgi:hypothetical integral membrane protein (TIGR02206 family)